MPPQERSSDTPYEHEYAVDERLVVPEARFEVIDGEVVYVRPSDQPHGSRHSKLSALLEAYSADGYDAASDMLTRTSERGDMAPDGSIYPASPEPETGGRQLEELAFEVVSTESLAAAGRKAASLRRRGVRRVFALDLERRRALEWSIDTNTWEILSTDAAIEDRALALPLEVRDLVEAAKTDDAVARALLAKRNPVLATALAEAKAAALLTVLRGRGLPVSDEQLARFAWRVIPSSTGGSRRLGRARAWPECSGGRAVSSRHPFATVRRPRNVAFRE